MRACSPPEWESFVSGGGGDGGGEPFAQGNNNAHELIRQSGGRSQANVKIKCLALEEFIRARNAGESAAVCGRQCAGVR